MVIKVENTPSERTQDAWCALFRTHKIVHETIEAELKSAGLPPLLWYDVLWQLEKSTECGLRAFEMQSKLLLPQYGMSRLINRIASKGLINRHECPEDGRGVAVSITDEGRKVRQKMWSVYAPAMQAALGEKLSTKEIETLTVLLRKIS